MSLELPADAVSATRVDHHVGHAGGRDMSAGTATRRSRTTATRNWRLRDLCPGILRPLAQFRLRT